MKDNAGRIAKKLARRQRRIEKRLQVARDSRFVRMMSGAPPVLSSTGLKYELADKTQAIVYGGVPLMLRVARESGLIDAIDQGVPILKWRCPYYESDHVLNLAMNALCEGTCLEHIERRRNDEAFLNAIGADSIPDPTTAGDFCRRFTNANVRPAAAGWTQSIGRGSMCGSGSPRSSSTKRSCDHALSRGGLQSHPAARRHGLQSDGTPRPLA